MKFFHRRDAEDRSQVSWVRSQKNPARGGPLVEVIEDAENGGFILRGMTSAVEADSRDVIESPR